MQLSRAKLSRFIFYGILFVVIFVLPRFVILYTDWLWFLEVGFENIFTTIFFSQLLIGIGTALFLFALWYVNTAVFWRLTNRRPVMVSIRKEDYIELRDVSAQIKTITTIAALLFAIFGGLFAASQWETVLSFFRYFPFGASDPIFQRDIGFYIFGVPYFSFLIGLGMYALVIAFIEAVALYIAKGALMISNQSNGIDNIRNIITISREAKIHLFALIALWFLFTALKVYFIRMPELLSSATGPFTGASYTDIHAVLPFLYVLLIVAVIGVFGSIWSIRTRKFKYILGAFLLYAGATILGGWLYPAVLQNFVVKPNELVKETPYLAHHIEATQNAWGLDAVKKRDLSGESTLTMRDIRDNEATIKNVRLWDRGPLLDTFGQIQEIRTYYNFVSVDNDRYVLDGEYRQVMLSPRELDSASLPQRNFINERLTFTHGMGVALGPVNEVTDEGLPVLFVKDLPPSSDFESIEITRPEIYFGEISNEYVVVNTKAKEFNYPSGEENIYTDYTGTGGVEMSFLRKILFALRFNSMKIFLSNDITSESRILYHRDIRDRARTALPFLEFDSDPYLVIDGDGTLKWIYDAYTATARYPYSQKIDGKTYMRNSVKVVIDAYDGSMSAYIADATDPLIKTYTNIFPGIFKPLDEMPENLRAHIRYPEDIFAYQTALYTIYHMESPQNFYNKEDQWEIPVLRGSAAGENIGPIMRRLIMKLPGEKREEFILMLPYTPRGKNNMSAWMVARSDGDNYGELIVYRFPKQSLIFGPQQIVSRINQDAEISRQISLWDQRGSEVIQGNLFVIPINESILYIRPLYLRAQGGKIPELKRVIVAYEKQIAMEETLDLALARIFGGSSTRVKTSSRATPSQDTSKNALIRQARQHFDRAQSALRQGNWSRYGEEMQKLEAVLRELE